MKKYLKWFNLNKFYTVNIFLWLSLLIPLTDYISFINIFFLSTPKGIDTVSNLLVLEGEIFIGIIVIFLPFFLFLIELILRKKNIIKTYNTLVLNKYLRIILSIIALIFIYFDFVLLNLIHHLVDYLYFDN